MQEEIDNIIGDEKSSEVKFSVIWGDFGKYTMGCIHSWSPIPLSVPVPQMGYDLKKEFAEQFLHGEIKKEYLKKIKPNLPDKMHKSSVRNIESLFSEENRKEQEQEQKRWEQFEEKIKAQIGSDENREYYRWLSGLNNDRPAAFSRKWAQRWVCKRAYEFGWTEELFSEFEEHCSYGRGQGPSGEGMERIGKKYQWIAFHEILARLSDNVYWVDRGYSDIEDKHYNGPWQMHKRDIDPTIWIRKNGEYRSFNNEVSSWWQPYKFPFSGIDDILDQQEFLWDKNKIPKFLDLLRIKDPYTQNQWIVLRGFWAEQQERRDSEARLDCWFRINTVFIRKQDYDIIKKELQNQKKSLISPDAISIPSTDHQGYFGEYPWHPVCQFMSGWRDPEGSFGDLVPTKHFVPISKYEWESGSTDHSLDHSLSFYLPAKELVESLDLRRTDNDFGAWENDGGVIFCDPSIKKYGPSYALMDSQKLGEWLDENGLDILWLIGGEKQLFSPGFGAGNFYGRLIYSGLFRLVNGVPTGSLWFEKEEPRERTGLEVGRRM